MAYDLRDFSTDVIDASRERPVLVDFWAPWCGPCRVLGPVLEKLAGEAGDAWNLVKVNSDEHPELSQQYGIRGIPAVKLFVDGEVADEFTGALPEHAVRQWLEKAIPSEERAQLARAEQALEDGDLETARPLFEQILAAEPRNPQAAALMARLLVFEDPERASSLADTAMSAEARYVQMAQAVRTLAGLASEHADELPEGPGKELWGRALEALEADDPNRAIETLIELLQVNRYYHDDAARRAGVALFTILGDTHPVTRRHRRTFDMWLY